MKTNSAEVRRGTTVASKEEFFNKLVCTKKGAKKYYTHEIFNYDTLLDQDYLIAYLFVRSSDDSQNNLMSKCIMQ